jgi:rod shape-determining protein MreD
MTDTSETASTLKVVASFMVAMILRIIPLPKDLALLNPDWVAIVLLYWILAIPERCGVLRAWVIGLIVDALTGRLLGQHALAYGLMAYLGLQGKASLAVLRRPAQALWILVILLIGQLIILWTSQQQLPEGMAATYWSSSLIGALMWPAMSFILSTRDARGLH